jgi:cysteinyl-tRNA synthetase
VVVSQLRVYNTLSRSVEDFVPAEPGKVRIYVCGMTTYDYCHIGHARAMLTFDMVVRWLRASGHEVTYVRNHTDVDDKIIETALKLGEDPLQLSARFVRYLEEDLARLGLLEPDHSPKVSETIPEIVEMTRRIVENGHAYEAEGDVYFSVESFPSYGALSGKRIEENRATEAAEAGARRRNLGDFADRKRHPGDFALWKGAKEGEISWPSPWGAGRPGWHIECSAMSIKHLGERFDIHGGGIDLIFPHHENEIAQSECATGHAPFARYWLHNGHLTFAMVHRDADSGEEVEAEVKMSKSLGNVVRIRDLLDQVPAEALRMLYLDAHYRSPLPYSATRLAECFVAMDRLYTARQVVEDMALLAPAGAPQDLIRDIGEPARELHEVAQAFPGALAEALNDDFNSARGVAALFELVRAINRYAANAKWKKRGAVLAGPALAAFELSGRAMGIGGMRSEAWFKQVREQRLRAIGRTEADVQALVDARTAAREARQWAEADRLRDELVGLGVIIMDGAGGTAWRMTVE